MCSVAVGLMALKGYMDYQQVSAEGKAQEASYKAQARNAEVNAEYERRRQEQIADKYAQDQMRLDDKRKLAQGQMVASAGASGMTMTGSGLDILASSEGAWMQDSRNLLQNQRYDNEASRAQETNYVNAANSYRAAAYNTRQATRQKKLGTILGTASSIYGAYSDGLVGGGSTKETAGDWADTYDYAGGIKTKWSDGRLYGWR